MERRGYVLQVEDVVFLEGMARVGAVERGVGGGYRLELLDCTFTPLPFLGGAIGKSTEIPYIKIDINPFSYILYAKSFFRAKQNACRPYP